MIRPTNQHAIMINVARQIIVNASLRTIMPTTTAAAKLINAKQVAIILEGMAEHSFAQKKAEVRYPAFYRFSARCQAPNP